jgi:2-keto-4-pentenoate hydratase/2-oxohepta-3-ene-1,7-dioic acid hydratase in catechol pathway
MKLATYSSGAEQRVGAVIDEGRRLVDLSGAFSDLLALIEAGDAGRATAEAIVADPPEGAIVDLAGVRLCAPLPRPPQIRDFLCFEEHLRNSFAQAGRMTGRTFEIPKVWYEQPIYYKGNRFSVIGPDDEIRWPGYADVLDYELELACVVGRAGVDISRADAPSHIFGYTIFNDVSARDAQLKEMAGQLGPAKGKDFDTGNIFGPWIVTADELGDPYDLVMTARINGEEWSRGNSGAMHHRFEDVIAFVSQSETLHPGEILGSGTVGTGCGLEQGRSLSPGDVIELEIDRIGVLRNRIVR